MLELQPRQRTTGEIGAHGIGEIATHAVDQGGHRRGIVQIFVKQRPGIGHREVAGTQHKTGTEGRANGTLGFREECRHQKFVLKLKRNVR